jgi:antitoxin MazE
MITQVARWGNSQGLRLPKKMLRSIGLRLNDSVDISVKGNVLEVKPIEERNINYFLEGYDDEMIDRYDWGELDVPKGREVW